MSPNGKSISLHNDSDPTLFERFRHGDDAAFQLLLQRHNRRLYAYCLKMLGDEEMARDVMQEMWERVIRFRGSDEVIANPVGLLMRIIRNLSLNHLRDEKRHLSLNELSESQHPGAGVREPSYLEELVVMALDRLPLPQREVLILRAYSGYDYAEIADMLELSVANVRMRAMRGRMHLARIMSALAAVEDERLRIFDALNKDTNSDSEDIQ